MDFKTKTFKKFSIAIFLPVVIASLALTGCGKTQSFDKDKALGIADDFVSKAYSYQTGENLKSINDSLKAECTDTVFKDRLDLSNNEVFKNYYGGTSPLTEKQCKIAESSVQTENDNVVSFILIVQSSSKMQQSSGASKTISVYFPLVITLNKDYKICNITEYSNGVKTIG